jgi:hypothetical protein
MIVGLKEKKKRTVKFVTDPRGGEGKMKGTKVSVATGLDKNSRPNKPEPKQAETQNIMPARNLAKRTPTVNDDYDSPAPPVGRPAPGARGRGGGPAPPSPGVPPPRAPSVRGRGAAVVPPQRGTPVPPRGRGRGGY